MATLTTPGVMLNKVVVAHLDGRRSRGRVYDFSPLKDTFRLVSESALQQQKGLDVTLKDLKAVFFVKDFRGNSKQYVSLLIIKY
jgi:predicted phosphatase